MKFIPNHSDNYIVLFVEIEAGKQTPYYIKSLGIEKGSFIRVGGTTRLAEIYYVKDEVQIKDDFVNVEYLSILYIFNTLAANCL